MGFLHLFIVNKSGSVIHHRDLGGLRRGNYNNSKIGTNEWLRIGSTFHSLHAIATEASPVRLPSNLNSYGAQDGIQLIESAGLILSCFQTRTGVKFVITAEPGTLNITQMLKEAYVAYTDYALKDPFYELDMPIKSDLFIQAIDSLVERYDNNGGFGKGSIRGR